MNTKTIKSFLALSTVPLLALSLMLTGCATRQQVAEIVSQSNAAMLAGQFGLPAPGPNAQQQPWEEASARIDAFIDAHPNQPDTTGPLRIRQAMLLLTHRQFSLAEAAFGAVKPNNLHSARDQALKRNQETLLWWFANSTKDTWSDADQASAKKALNQLKEDQSNLAESPDIRDYLAEMRAWIGLSSAKQTTSVPEAKSRLEDALNVYAETFTEEDLEKLKAREEALPDASALAADVRRRLRARAVLAFARKVNRDNNLAAHPANQLFNQIINE